MFRSAILIAMDQWPIQIRIQAVEAFIRLNSVIAVQRFLRQDRYLRVPDRRTIVRWVQSWREHGKVENKKSSGRPRTVRTPENINRVPAEIQQSPLLPNLLMSDEAHFHLTGFVNKQNFCSYQMAKVVHCFQINCMLRH
ncbi:hypothetical protein C0J52_20182 [Blattella germanica]|nr:hypothetical protein C0J52_20182 [Blattella germanica]